MDYRQAVNNANGTLYIWDRQSCLLYRYRIDHDVCAHYWDYSATCYQQTYRIILLFLLDKMKNVVAALPFVNRLYTTELS